MGNVVLLLIILIPSKTLPNLRTSDTDGIFHIKLLTVIRVRVKVMDDVVNVRREGVGWVILSFFFYKLLYCYRNEISQNKMFHCVLIELS